MSVTKNHATKVLSDMVKLIGKTETQYKIETVLSNFSKFLLEKNIRYGDSALKPKNIFYKGDAINSILIRLDDKLSRIINNAGELRKNDVADVIGYLTLLCVSQGWEDFNDLLD
jgi:signal transduction histidine kinase